MSSAKAHQSVVYPVTAGDVTIPTGTAPPGWASGTFVLTCVIADNGAIASANLGGGVAELTVRCAAGQSRYAALIPGLPFAPTATNALVLSRGAAGSAFFIGYWD